MKVIDPIEMMDNIIASGTHHGLKWCVCLAPHKFFINGYVQLPTNHPYYSRDYDNIPAQAPGGLTFSNNGVVGFDTGHAFDVWTNEELQKYGGKTAFTHTESEHNIYWTLDMVIEETKQLANQLASIKELA